MRTTNWFVIILLVLIIAAGFVILPLSLFHKWFYVLLFSCFITIYRLAKGPTPSDRAAAVKVLSVIVIGFCSIMTTLYNDHIYIDVAIAWAFQAFVGTIVLAKYIEGKHLDD